MPTNPTAPPASRGSAATDSLGTQAAHAYLCSVKVEGGTIAWDNRADIDPDALYYDLKPAWMENPEAV